MIIMIIIIIIIIIIIMRVERNAGLGDKRWEGGNRDTDWEI
jgi:preprotein translocase subunit SecG